MMRCSDCLWASIAEKSHSNNSLVTPSHMQQFAVRLRRDCYRFLYNILYYNMLVTLQQISTK
jgi:hypothetical protein